LEAEAVAEEAALGDDIEPVPCGLRSAGDLGWVLEAAERWERSAVRAATGEAPEADMGVATSSTTGLKNWTEARVEAASLELAASLEDAMWGDTGGASS
jgi:hypothetical protein